VASGKTRPASVSGNPAAARLAALARPRSAPNPFSVGSMGRSRSAPSRSVIDGGRGSVTSPSDLRRPRPEYGFGSDITENIGRAFSP